MTDLAQGYREVPEEERQKAQKFFDRARTVADTGNYEYAIDLYIMGLAADPDSVKAHQDLRDYSLKRKVSGGKPMGMLDRMKFKTNTKDEKQNMLNAEKLLAFAPGNTDYMKLVFQSAFKLGYYDTVMWMGGILLKANMDLGKAQDYGKYITLKDAYRAMAESDQIPPGMKGELWRRATEACGLAFKVRPDDMSLATEMKNLGAQETMYKGNYEGSGSFRDSVRDLDAQQRLLDMDKGVQTIDLMTRLISEARAEWEADPSEPGKLTKYVDVLDKTEMLEHENIALEILDEAYHKTRQFRWRLRTGQIKIKQMKRMARSMLEQLGKDDPDYKALVAEQVQFELSEYQLWAENYPTQTEYRHEMAKRLFKLGRFDEVIPLLQAVRQDPKFKHEATLLLGRSFLEAGFDEEAIDTLEAAINDYQLRGDTISKELYYWSGRSLEKKGEKDQSLKRFSQVAQWDWNYRDVQARIKRLRGIA